MGKDKGFNVDSKTSVVQVLQKKKVFFLLKEKVLEVYSYRIN